MIPEIGVSLPVFLARFGSTPPDIAAVARHAERIGLDALWSGDHLMTDAPLVDSTVALSVAAAVTERVHLGYSVLLLALRHPAWAARQIGSLQVVSGNRMVLGVGVGGQWPGEWQAAGVPLRDRGRRTDALLELLPGLLAGEPTRLATEPGEPVVTLAPAVPMPPVWVGGMSGPALRRAVRAQGWLGSLLTPDQLAARGATLAAIAEGEKAPTPALGVVVFAQLSERGPTGGDRLAGYLSRIFELPRDQALAAVVDGSPQLLAERLAAYAAAGARRVIVSTFGTDVREQYDLVAQAKRLLVS